jgi:lactoylglutathione lyase
MRTILALLALAPLLPAQPQRPRILGSPTSRCTSAISKSRAPSTKTFSDSASRSRSTTRTKSLALTFIKVNDRQYIELFPGLKPGADRLNHISIQTDDAEAMRVYLASRSVAVPAKTPKGRIKNSNFNVKDPDGHTVEIVQYEPTDLPCARKGST